MQVCVCVGVYGNVCVGVIVNMFRIVCNRWFMDVIECTCMCKKVVANVCLLIGLVCARAFCGHVRVSLFPGPRCMCAFCSGLLLSTFEVDKLAG